MATLQELLTEAEGAYHDLQIGKAVSVARDSNGEEIRYTQANRNDLLAYVTSLRNQIAAAAGKPIAVLGPMRFRF